MDSTFSQNSSLYRRWWRCIPTLVCHFSPITLLIPKTNPIRFDIHQYLDLSVGPWDEEGILETVTGIHGLIEHEIKVNSIPAERIVVAGLSQGSGMAVWYGLSITGGKLSRICWLTGRRTAKGI